MPQLDIKDIEIFHRDNYPANTGRITVGLLDTISIIIDPEFTEIENKADDFFTFKPRRFKFSVRLADTTFFDAIGTYIVGHPNFPKLTDYMIRIFNSSDMQIFEGIISMDSAFDYKTQTIDVMVYDPLILFGDCGVQVATSALENPAHKPPALFQAYIFDLIIDRYFLTSTYQPVYSTDWTIPDWGIGDYRNLFNWGTDIDTFYEYITATAKPAATAYFAGKTPAGTITDVYDYSKLEVKRGTDWRLSVGVIFIGCVVFVDTINNYNYCVLWYSGGYYSKPTDKRYDLPENIEVLNPVIYTNDNSWIETSGHSICQYMSYRPIYGHKIDYGQGSIVYHLDTAMGFFNIISWLPYTGVNGQYSQEVLTPVYKAFIKSQEYPTWMPLNVDTDYYEDMRSYSDSWDWFLYMATLYRNQFALKDEAGNYIYTEYANDIMIDHIYTENNENVILKKYWTAESIAVPAVATSQISNYEDGIYDLMSSNGCKNDFSKYVKYKFHINYGTAYSTLMTEIILGIDANKLHKIGNISAKIGYIPANCSYAPLTGATDYDFIVPDDSELYFKFADLLKFFLASMNLYCHYEGNTFVLQRSFTSGETPIIIANSDLIDWKTQSEEISNIDTSGVLNVTVNYIPEMLDEFYNTVAILDNSKATCLVSRLFNPSSYASLNINKLVTVFAGEADEATYRIDKFNPTEAYYNLSLTKYLTEPVL